MTSHLYGRVRLFKPTPCHKMSSSTLGFHNCSSTSSRAKCHERFTRAVVLISQPYLIGTAHSVYAECPYWWLEWAVPIRFGCEMRMSAAARHGDDAAVARCIKSFVCSRSGHLTLLWQQVSHMDALPRVYYFYLWEAGTTKILVTIEFLREFCTSQWCHKMWCQHITMTCAALSTAIVHGYCKQCRPTVAFHLIRSACHHVVLLFQNGK
jgi:hypothetical protein